MLRPGSRLQLLTDLQLVDRRKFVTHFSFVGHDVVGVVSPLVLPLHQGKPVGGSDGLHHCVHIGVLLGAALLLHILLLELNDLSLINSEVLSVLS